jgi:hypothetical protein
MQDPEIHREHSLLAHVEGYGKPEGRGTHVGGDPSGEEAKLMGRDPLGCPCSPGAPRIPPFTPTKVSKSCYISPQFGDMDGVKRLSEGVKVHDESGFAENLEKGRERVSNLQCSHEEALQDLERTYKMVGAPGRVSVSENSLSSREVFS